MIEYTNDTNTTAWRDRKIIEKKVLPEYYDGLKKYKKMFELRKDEDDIHPGDILVLMEWDGEKYTGNKLRREVTCVLRDVPEYGLMDGYCILSLQVPGIDYARRYATLDTLSEDIVSKREVVGEIHKYFAGEIEKTPTGKDEDGDEVYLDMKKVNALLRHNKHLSNIVKGITRNHDVNGGKWEFDEKGYFYCSVCGKKPEYQISATDYCPNCGEKMT